MVKLVEIEQYCLCMTVPAKYYDKIRNLLTMQLNNNIYFLNAFKETWRKNQHCDIIISGNGIVAWHQTNKLFNKIKNEIPEHHLTIYSVYEHNRVNFGDNLLEHVTMST